LVSVFLRRICLTSNFRDGLVSFVIFPPAIKTVGLIDWSDTYNFKGGMEKTRVFLLFVSPISHTLHKSRVYFLTFPSFPFGFSRLDICALGGRATSSLNSQALVLCRPLTVLFDFHAAFMRMGADLTSLCRSSPLLVG
jgi:hypothetical protein